MSRVTTDDLRRAGLTVKDGKAVKILNHKPIYGKTNSRNQGMGATQPEQDQVRPLDSNHAPEKRGVVKARVRITRYGLRELDEDNLHGSCKALLDGLVVAGLLRGDSPKDIELEVKQDRVSKRAEIKTVIEIEEIEP